MKRVIPVLLIQNGGIVKSIKFKNHTYVGDPFNAVKIFNEKEVDEIVILDISATKEKRRPNINFIREIAGEAFMPLAYGGGISNIEEVKEILYQGVEKVIFNTTALLQPNVITQTAYRFGNSSTVVSIDVGKNIFNNYKVFAENGKKNTGIDVLPFAKKMVELGAGELLINSVERDGTFQGFDLTLIKQLTDNIDIPIIACGGAGSYDDLAKAINLGGASAVAAGSIFVFQGVHRAVLISYPEWNEIQNKFN